MSPTSRTRAFILALAVLPPLLAACVPSPGDLTGLEIDWCEGVTGVRLTPSPRVAVGDSLQLGAMALDGSGDNMFCTAVAWSSATPPVVWVSPTGLIKGVAPGSAWVRATVAGVTDSVRVTVDPAGGTAAAGAVSAR